MITTSLKHAKRLDLTVRVHFEVTSDLNLMSSCVLSLFVQLAFTRTKQQSTLVALDLPCSQLLQPNLTITVISNSRLFHVPDPEH